jgi:hypothetical protein
METDGSDALPLRSENVAARYSRRVETAADWKSADSFGNGSDALPLRAEKETLRTETNAFPLRCSGAMFAPGWGTGDGRKRRASATPGGGRGFRKRCVSATLECSGAIIAPRVGGAAADWKSADSFGNGSDALPLRSEMETDYGSDALPLRSEMGSATEATDGSDAFPLLSEGG